MSSPTPSRPTDSVWFWLMVFSSFALIGAVVISAKHAQRQARLVRMNDARDEIRLSAPDAAATPSVLDVPDDPIVEPEPDRRTSLWPIIAPLIAVMILSWWKLRAQIRLATDN